MLDQGPRLKLNRSGYWTLVSAARGEDGKWRTRTVSCGTRDEAQAQAFRRAFVSAGASQDEPDPITVGSLVAAYQENARDRDVRKGQFASLRPIVEHLGGYAPEDVTLELQRAYRQTRQVSNGTLRRELGALTTVFNWAVKHKKLDRSAAPHIEAPDAPPPREVFLDEVEEARLWALAAADRDEQGRVGLAGLFVCLALGTGARSGAIYALTWDRVNLKSGTVDFRIPGERVTKKRKVHTLINARLLPVLAQARLDYPFARRVIEHGIRWRLTGFLEQHGFGHVTPHAFRHTFVTLLLRGGMGIWDVSELAGMSPFMAYKVYGHHVSDDRLRAAANRRFS